jgi:hypothetical protein
MDVSSASTSNIPGKIGQDSRKLQIAAMRSPTWFGQVSGDTVSYYRPQLHARYVLDSA